MIAGDLPDAAALRRLAQASAAHTDQHGWQQHHVLPLGLRRSPQLAVFFDLLDTAGPPVLRSGSNIMLLPCTEQVARAAGMALHRGPHPQYTDVVAARIEAIRAGHGSDLPAARSRIIRLQRALTRSLASRHGPLLWLNRSDPMRLFQEYAALDDAITAMIED